MKIYATLHLLSRVFLGVFLFGFSAIAAPQTGHDENRYRDCMNLAARSPDKAINNALVWKNEGGGVPARHCEAVGLFHMGEYEEAAARMELIASDMRTGKGMPVSEGKRLVASSSMMADMYGQAAKAWLEAGEIIRAEGAIDQALGLAAQESPQALDLLVDRARIAAADEDYHLALTDLETVKRLDAGRKDILVLIASAARGIGDFNKALSALDIFQEVYPENTAGHLERANLMDVQGFSALARQSWLKVLAVTEFGPDADAARANLERTDVNKDR
ncbi:MAG: hypothetical protein JKY60_19720 [Kordiimonadaceae bacterium]|nr:hypothetical protein [Kordiimonadaceae bacterium]